MWLNELVFSAFSLEFSQRTDEQAPCDTLPSYYFILGSLLSVFAAGFFYYKKHTRQIEKLINKQNEFYNRGEEYYNSARNQIKAQNQRYRWNRDYTSSNENYKKALDCYAKACILGTHAEAEFSLGWLYQHGNGTEKQLSMAVAWYVKAATKGHASAKRQLQLIIEAAENDRRANELYSYFSIAYWLTSLTPSNIVKKAGQISIIPISGYLADWAGLPGIATAGRWSVEGISFVTAPIEYVVKNAVVRPIAHGVVRGLNVRNPYIRAGLMISADGISDYVSRHTQNLITNNTVNLSVPSQEENTINKLLIENNPYVIKNGQRHVVPRNSAVIASLQQQGYSVQFLLKSEDKAFYTQSSIDSEVNQPLIEQPDTSILLPAKSESTEMKVYFGTRPLNHKLIGLFRYVNPKARHAFIIVEDPIQGFIEIGLGPEDKRKGNIITTAQLSMLKASSNKSGTWIYQVGMTNMTTDQIIENANKWLGDHPNYQWWSDNCRSFVDSILRRAFLNGNGTLFRTPDGTVRINSHNFKKSPSVECEHRIHTNGFN